MRISDWSSDVCSSDLGGTGKSCVCGTGQAEARTCQDAAKPLRRKEKRRHRRAVVLVIVDAMWRQSARIGRILIALYEGLFGFRPGLRGSRGMDYDRKSVV